MKRVIVIFLIFGLSLLIKSCDTTDPPDNKSLALKLEDVSCTESWIKLTTTNLQLPTTVTLKQNNQTISTINLVNTDTLLYIDSLLPNTTYKYQVSCIQNPVSSNELSVTTMDTTSHNFTWQTFEFGQHSSSVLYDLAIIDENNIWAVGEIYLNDSIGQPDPNAYNAVHWDGTSWELKRIFFPTVCGSTNLTPYPAKSIFTFNDGQIWVSSSGDKIKILQESNQMSQFCLPSNVSMSINKIWGSSSNDLYLVGNNGNIAHYNSSQWTMIESGTDVDIQDIWGINDGSSDPFILCAASNVIEPGEHKIININNSNRVDTLYWFANKRVNSIWMSSKFQLFACGDGMYISSCLITWKQQELTPVFKTRIRGNSKNDLFMVGGFGLLAHYNGVSWREYPEASSALVYTSLDYKNDLMVTVGYTQTKAVIQFMIRN